MCCNRQPRFECRCRTADPNPLSGCAHAHSSVFARPAAAAAQQPLFQQQAVSSRSLSVLAPLPRRRCAAGAVAAAGLPGRRARHCSAACAVLRLLASIRSAWPWVAAMGRCGLGLRVGSRTTTGFDHRLEQSNAPVPTLSSLAFQSLSLVPVPVPSCIAARIVRRWNKERDA